VAVHPVRTHRQPGVRFAGLPVLPAGQPGRGARRGRHLLGVLVLVRRGAHPRRAPGRGGSGGGFGGSGRRSSPAGIPPAAPVIGHPAPSGCSGAACCGTAGLKNRDILRAVRPGNQATGFQPLAGMSPVTVSSSLARQEPRQRGVVSSPAIRPRVACLSRWPGCLAVPFSCAGQFSSDGCGTRQGRPWRQVSGSRSGSHRRQILSDAGRLAQTIRPARCLIERSQATYRDASGVPINERVLGPEHPDTLIVRSNLAYYTGGRAMRPEPATSTRPCCLYASGSPAESTPTP
jgi:hypothetical protein